jgi:predicted nucleic acid-binding protein
MKIFIDTNIFLDLILKREKYKEAKNSGVRYWE